ncbi:MAG: HEAT repeat domain-containing protein [Microcoleus sp. CSU_2_2]|nr:HEAT repeat domain-containing protein [Microcoleus sp. SU_5_3]NJS10407.1 HEAT repeat domain-containing protein [Microcoleus sp. CSU_2_2]
MSNVLEQAQVAADRKNWPQLVQCLQQLSIEGQRPYSQPQLTTDEPIEQAQETDNLKQVVSLAIKVLEWGDFQDRWDVAKILPNLGTSAIAPLIAVLEDEDADTEQRWFAARILGEFDRPEVIQALAELVKNPDEELSQIAAETLANLGPTAIDCLTTLLLQEDLRQFATSALAQIRRSETIAPLLTVVKDPQAAVRTAAIEALSSFHDPRIPPVLVEALTDPATAVRKEAARSLGLRSYLDGELDLVKLLKPLLWDIRLEVCSSAAIAIGRLKTDAAAAALVELLRSATTPVALQIEAIRALGWMETAAALDNLQQVLITRFSEINSTVCQEIVIVLGRVETPELKAKAAEILIDLLAGDRPTVQLVEIKKSLAVGLGKLGNPRALDALIQMLADPDNSVRLHSTAALKQLSADGAKQQLESLVKQDNLEPELKQGITIALQEWQEN